MSSRPLRLRRLTGQISRCLIIYEFLKERRRHLELGWDADHDDAHRHGDLAKRAAELLVDGTDASVDDPLHDPDPWGMVAKHGYAGSSPDRLRALVIAGSLIVAEIERELRREEKRESTQ